MLEVAADIIHENNMRNDYEYFLNHSHFDGALDMRNIFFKEVEKYGWDLEQAMEDFENS